MISFCLYHWLNKYNFNNKAQMKTKQTGVIRKFSLKKIGTFYQTQILSHSPVNKKLSPKDSKVSDFNRGTIHRKRSQSIGKIYSKNKQNLSVSRHRQQRADFSETMLLKKINTSQRGSNASMESTSKQMHKQKYSYIDQLENNFHETIGKNIIRYNAENLKSNYGVAEDRVLTQKKLTQNRINGQIKSKRTSKFQLPSTGHQVKNKDMEAKLKKIIEVYQNKNRELTSKLENFTKNQKFINEKQALADLPLKHLQTEGQKAQPSIEPASIRKIENQKKERRLKTQEVHNQLDDVFLKLQQFNEKQLYIQHKKQPLLDELWFSFNQQVKLEEQLRILKSFIRDENAQQILQRINKNRIKKLVREDLKFNSEEYDPFLLEKLQQQIDSKSLRLEEEGFLSWVCSTFQDKHQAADHHWQKHLNSEQIEIQVRNILLNKQSMTCARKGDCEFTLKYLSRNLSIILKVNLRNRNVFRIWSKLKDYKILKRFMEVSEERADIATSKSKSLSKLR